MISQIFMFSDNLGIPFYGKTADSGGIRTHATEVTGA